MSAEYLFMTDKLYDVKYDTGDKVIQCGRHNDIFKLWLQWRAKVDYILIIERMISKNFWNVRKIYSRVPMVSKNTWTGSWS